MESKVKKVVGAIVKVLSMTILTVMSLSLIGAGWVQEVFWYHSVFTGNGLEDIFSYIAGGSLSLLLCYFAIKKGRRSFYGLLGFSILITVIGQNQEYTEKKGLYISQTAQEDKKESLNDYYKGKIEETNNSIKFKNSQIPENVEDQAEWITNGVNPLRKDIILLESKLERYESKMETIALSKSVITEPKTSYDNFFNDLSFIPAIVARYLLLVLTSFFIALMAPSGFVLMRNIWGFSKQEDINKPKERASSSTEELVIFTNSLYRFDENPPTLKSRTEVTRETGLSYGYFNKHRKIALDLGLIRKMNNNLTTPIANKSEFTLHMETKQPYKGSIRAVR